MIVRPLDIPPEIREQVPPELQSWLSREACRGFAALEIEDLYAEVEKGIVLTKKINSSANILREYIKLGAATGRLPMTYEEVLEQTRDLQARARTVRDGLAELVGQGRLFHEHILNQILYLQGAINDGSHV